MPKNSSTVIFKTYTIMSFSRFQHCITQLYWEVSLQDKRYTSLCMRYPWLTTCRSKDKGQRRSSSYYQEVRQSRLCVHKHTVYIHDVCIIKCVSVKQYIVQ